jgi:hypothetical protein
MSSRVLSVEDSTEAARSSSQVLGRVGVGFPARHWLGLVVVIA